MRPSCRPFRFLVALIGFGLAACATAPPPAPAPAATADGLEQSSLLCGQGAAFLSFEKLGVPKGARPVKLVKIGPRIWILFEPARLVRIDRRGEAADIGVRLGGEGENWSSLALDPVDGSLWLAARDRLALWHYEATGKLRIVPLQKVEGEGGFYDLAAAPSGLFVEPTAAQHSIWRVGRDGKVLSTDFPAPPIDPAQISSLEGSEAAQGGAVRSAGRVRLEHDRDGAVLVWFGGTDEVFRADAAGNWAPVDPGIFSSGSDEPVRGVDVGTKNEHWYVNGRGALFYWKGTPVFLGSHSMLEQQGKMGTIFHFPGGRELFEACNGWFIFDVAVDDSGYAALTDRGVVIGDFAGTP
ncbi:MAG TPA: hypothetical protein VGS22_08850 [Thermoanaerobaculia bacterium]|jgi:hypothetical protein|nr:hypothetical protein [Thermoanaerobaculia bacterium]